MKNSTSVARNRTTSSTSKIEEVVLIRIVFKTNAKDLIIMLPSLRRRLKANRPLEVMDRLLGTIKMIGTLIMKIQEVIAGVSRPTERPMIGVKICKRRVKLAGMSQFNLASQIGPTKKEKSPSTCGTLMLNHQLKNLNYQPSKCGRKTRVLHLVMDGT